MEELIAAELNGFQESVGNGSKWKQMPPRHGRNDLICNLVFGNRYHRDTVLRLAQCK